MKRPLIKLDEKAVTKQVRSFMEYRGWRYLRTQVVAGPGYSIGEPGCADSLYIHYGTGGAALLIWCEYKSPTDARKCACTVGKTCKVCRQRQWQERERQRGATVVVVRDIAEYAAWYDVNFGYLHRGDQARGQTELAL